jgi:hypothetical protein
MTVLNRKRMATLAAGVVFAAALDIVGLVAVSFGFGRAGYDLLDPANDVLIDSVSIAVVVGITLFVTGISAMASGNASPVAREVGRRETTAA